MATATATAAIDSTAPRLPSTRPIDHRWDRSRGIIFTNAKRPSANDQTWSASNGIVFGQPPASTRSYAIRSSTVKIPPPAQPLRKPGQPPGKPTPVDLDNAHKSPGFARGRMLTQQEGTELQSRIVKLEAEKEALQEEKARTIEHIQNLKTTIQDLEQDKQTLAKQIIEKSDKHARDLTEKEREQRREIDKIRELADPSRKENDAVLAAVREEGRRLAEQQYATTIKLSREQAAEQTRIANDATKQRMESEKYHQDIAKRATEANEQFERRATALRAENEKIRREVFEREKRGKTDRADYTIYQNIFAELKEAHYQMRDTLRLLSESLEKDAQAWRKAAATFEGSRTLGLFHQMSKYQNVRTAIVDFLEGRATSARAAATELAQFQDRANDTMSVFRSESHDSRKLTRLLHFEPQHGLGAAMNLAFFFDRTDAMKKRLGQVHRQLAGFKGWTSQKAVLGAQQIKLAPIRDIVEHVQKIAALQALLQDTNVEKLVYLQTHAQKEELNRVVDASYDIAERDGEGKDFYQTFNLTARYAREALRDYELLIRKKALLEDELGLMKKEKITHLDNEIRARIEHLEQELTEFLSKAEVPTAAGSTLSKVRAAKRRRVSVTVPLRSGSRTVPNDLSRETIARRWRNLDTCVKKRDRLRAAGKPVPENLMRDISVQLTKMEAAGLISQTKHRALLHGAVKSSETPLESSQEWESDVSASGPDEISAQTIKTMPEGRISTRRLRRQRLRTGQYTPFSKRSYHSMSASSSIDMRREYGHHSALYPDLSGAIELQSRAADASSPSQSNRQSHAASQASDSQPASSSASSAASDLSFAPTESSADAAQGETQTDQCQPSAHASEEQFASTGSTNETQTDQCEPSVDASEEQPASTGSANAEAEPQVELSYQIPPGDYRAAVMSSTSTNAAFWSHKMYKNPEGKQPVVYYCRNFEVAEAKAQLFLDEPVLGFDLEWEPKASSKSGIKQNISLIQIAAQDKIGLFHISCFAGTTAEELLPPSLRKILVSPDVIKTGVNISGDLRRVKEYLDTEMKGSFELSHLYKIVKFSASEPRKVNFSLVSLAKQVQDILLLPLKKDENRVSHWSRPLNSQQSDYAASDAYAGFRLFHKLDSQRKAMDPTPPRPAFFETYLPLILGDGTEIVRKQRRPAAKAVPEAAAEEEEDEEFFDAVEELDPYELNSADPSAAVEDDGEPSPIIDTAGASVMESDDAVQEEASSDSLTDLPADRASKPITTSIPKTIRPDTPETRLAETWISTYNSSRARPGELRAYHLWHEQQFSISDVAAFMKEPPLTLTTVASYVMQSLKEEGLPFDKERLRKEVLSEIPRSVWGRYWKVLKDVEEKE